LDSEGGLRLGTDKGTQRSTKRKRGGRPLPGAKRVPQRKGEEYLRVLKRRKERSGGGVRIGKAGRPRHRKTPRTKAGEKQHRVQARKNGRKLVGSLRKIEGTWNGRRKKEGYALRPGYEKKKNIILSQINGKSGRGHSRKKYIIATEWLWMGKEQPDKTGNLLPRSAQSLHRAYRHPAIGGKKENYDHLGISKSKRRNKNLSTIVRTTSYDTPKAEGPKIHIVGDGSRRQSQNNPKPDAED